MKRKIVSLFLAGCLITKGVTISFAAESGELENVIAETTESINDPSNVEVEDTEIVESDIIDNINTEDIEANVSETEDETKSKTSSADKENESISNESNETNEKIESSEKDSKIKTSEGDTYFEIITNDDGSQVKIVYEYVLNEETGELEAIAIEEIDGSFDEDGNLLVEETEIEDNEEVEDAGKIIGFESLSSISFDHVPTKDELIETLPTTATAIVKGEDENTYVSVDISFDNSEIDKITTKNKDNQSDETTTHTLTASVSTDLEFADGVSNPELNVIVLDEGFNLIYQELTSENNAITVSGMMPENAILNVEQQGVLLDFINNMLTENYDTLNVENNDVVNMLYLAADESLISITYEDGKEFMPMDGYPLLVTINLSAENVSKIAGNEFTVYYGEEEVEHSFDAEAGTISFMTTELNDIVSIIGTETIYYYDVSFSICSKDNNNEVLFESFYRVAKGTEINLPEFTSTAYDIDSIDWTDVQTTVTHDASYTKYVDSISYDIEVGTENSLEVTSYGDELIAEDIFATENPKQDIVTEYIDTVDETSIENNIENDSDTDVNDPTNKIDEFESENSNSESKESNFTDDVIKKDTLVSDKIEIVNEDIE